MTLADLQEDKTGVIVKVKGRGVFRRRITEMGFVKGKKVTRIKNAPLNDPIEYSLMGYNISLRKAEANLIEILTEDEAQTFKEEANFFGTQKGSNFEEIAKEKSKHIEVALVGNPNCGKTTIFNFASGLHEKVGNYSGVTVDIKQGVYKYKGYTFKLVDLPGTYSLSAYSPEELYVRRYIFNNSPDIVLNVVDTTNIERNLFLTTQLIDMDVKVVMALNMFDEHEAGNDSFDYNSMGGMIGIPMVPTVGSKGIGVNNLFDTIIKVYEDNEEKIRHVHINYGKDVEKAILRIQEVMWENAGIREHLSSRFYAIKLLEKDKGVSDVLQKYPNYNDIMEMAEKRISILENLHNEDSENLITDAKYGFISGALKETYEKGTNEDTARNKTQRIDKVLTHKWLGFPIFIGFLWLMFQTVFSLGKYPMSWIENLVSLLHTNLKDIIPDGLIKDLLLNGILEGVGGVIVFLPNIIILFLFIAFMEDTGYMSRAAFIMDKLMHRIGLHGKSFIPLIMGFGCNVPAIMATRTIENRNERLLTMLINPFMSCSARLPVYILLIAAFFPKYPVLVLFSVYMIGILFAIVLSIIFKKVIFKSKEVPFVMELPPYRIPTLKSVLQHMWFRSSQYLKKMGGVILFASLIIWFLGYFPRDIQFSKDYDQQILKIEQEISGNKDLNENELTSKKQHLKELNLERESERNKSSYIGQIGQIIEPVIKPLGFDWRIGVSLLSGIAAKEVVISTLGVLYHVDVEEESSTLSQRIASQKYDSGPLKGQIVFSTFSAFGLLMFILLYFPCVAVISAVKKESGSWKWAFFMMVYTTTLAWVVAFVINQIGKLF